MTGRRLQGNPDPSRKPGRGAAGNDAGGRDDQAGLRGFADGGSWRGGAVPVWPARGSRCCNSVGRDRSVSIRRTSRRRKRQDRTVAEELLQRAPPSVTAGLDNGRGSVAG